MVTYIELGRKSDPDTYNPYHKFAILMLNEEFYNQFHKHWQYFVAFSYRKQNEYLEQAPYDLGSPNFEREFRLYSRFSYIHKTPRLKLAATLRQEFRKFYEPNFTNWSENYQLRSRLWAQAALIRSIRTISTAWSVVPNHYFPRLRNRYPITGPALPRTKAASRSITPWQPKACPSWLM